MLNLVETYENLVAVPSCHFQPVFAEAVRAAMKKFRPNAVAVELPDMFSAEMAWLVSCWPVPVVSVTESRMIPCVPGDSILEAYRLGTARKIPVFCVDLAVAGVIRRPGMSFPSSELAPRMGRMFLEASDAIQEQAGPAANVDLAREAFMTTRLAELMRRCRCVLWVGGMAHWTRIVSRLKNHDFAGPQVDVVQSHTTRRARLAPTALYRMTGRIPFLLARYAKAPDRYDEPEAIRALGLAACSSKADVSLRIEGCKGDTEDGWPEPARASIDVARMLLYARNLAASSGLREMPDLGELLRAASATMGSHYAGRLCLLAMRELLTAKSRGLPPLTYENEGALQGYRLDGQWVSVEPYWEPVGGTGMMWVVQQSDAVKKMREPYANVSGGKKGDQTIWTAYPPEEAAYEAFVRYVLEHASLPDFQESKSFPFQAGLRDGVDVRNTIRHRKDGTVYVREQANARQRITNAVIDFSSRNEQSAILQGKPIGKERGGWIDPDCQHVGSCSREVIPYTVLQEQPCFVQRDRREFSFVSLDVPTWIPNSKAKTFYDRVIQPLLGLRETGTDTLYDWLDVFFRFCRRKSVAYYAAYVPSQRIHRIARKHRVRIVHIPLSRIPKPLLDRNRSFRFMNLTQAQWEEFLKINADQKNAWITERCDGSHPRIPA